MFCFPNRGDAGSGSSGGWEGTLPLANLTDPLLSKVARSTDATLGNTKFDWDLTSDQYIWLVALIGDNLSQAAKYRIRGSNDPTFASSVYDSGWLDVYIEIYPSGVLNYGDPGWFDGKLAADDYDLGYRVPITHVLPQPESSRYWRIEIDDTANTDGYVEFGRLWLSYAYQPTINFSEGAGLGYDESSTTDETDGGVTFHDERARRRRFNFTLPMADMDEALVRGFNILRQLGTSSQVFFVYREDDTHHMHRRSFLATLHDLNALEIAAPPWADQAFSLIEEL